MVRFGYENIYYIISIHWFSLGARFCIPPTTSSKMVNENDFLTLTINSYANSLSNLLPIGSTVFINDHSEYSLFVNNIKYNL